MFIPKVNEVVVYSSDVYTRFKILKTKDVYISFVGKKGERCYFLLTEEDFVINDNIATFIGDDKRNGYSDVITNENYIIDGYDIMTDNSLFLDGKYIKPLNEYRNVIIEGILK